VKSVRTISRGYPSKTKEETAHGIKTEDVRAFAILRTYALADW
jgi:hypothetical protein